MISDANFYPRNMLKPACLLAMKAAVARFYRCNMRAYTPPVSRKQNATKARTACCEALSRMFPDCRRYEIAAALGVEDSSVWGMFVMAGRLERGRDCDKFRRAVEVAIRAYCEVDAARAIAHERVLAGCHLAPSGEAVSSDGN